MPFDTANVPDFVRHNLGWTGNNERDPMLFIPYFDHVRDNIIVHRNGGLMAMIRMDGENFTLSSNRDRNGHRRRHFALYQLVGDPQTEITESLVCHDNVEPFAGALGGSEYWQEFYKRYDTRALRGARRFDWFISITVHPRPLTGAWMRKIKKGVLEFFNLDDGIPLIERELIRRLESKVRTVTTAFKHLNPQRLGTYRNEHGRVCSAIGRALHLIRTTRLAHFPLTQPAGSFGGSLYRDRVIHGSLGFQILRAGGTHGATVGRAFAITKYPTDPTVGMLDPLLSDDERVRHTRWVLTNSCRAMERAKGADELELMLDRIDGTKPNAITERAETLQALNEIASSREIRAYHGWTFVVHDDDMESLDTHAAHLTDILVNSGGMSIAPAGIASEVLYWSQWPGNRKLHPAPAKVGMNRLAILSPLEGYTNRPSQTPRWGAPILRFLNSGGGAYDHEIFDGSIGHALFCGPSGSGKSVLIGALCTAATALIHRPNKRGNIIVCDKDRSQRLMVLNNGGAYADLQRGEDSGAAPLRRLENTQSDRLAAFDLIVGMICADGKEAPSEKVKEQLRRGIAFEMRKPAEQRRIASIHAWLPTAKFDPTDSANRLKPWCRGERMGWAFDGARDDFDFNSEMIGIDYTSLLDDTEVLPIMAAYMFYLTKRIMDGRRIIFVAEELQFLLPKYEFTKIFEDMFLTGRKKNLILWPSIQQPETILMHPLGPVILNQCRTRYLLKNEFAIRDAYCGRVGSPYGNGLGCTEKMYEQISGKMTVGAHSVLIQRPGRDMLCRFDLSSQPEDIAILSGTQESNDLWTEITLADHRKEFVRRLHEVER